MTVSRQALEQAAHWYAVLQSDTVTESERQDWRRWLEAGDSHEAAWACIERVSQRFEPLRGTGSAGVAAAVAGVSAARAAQGRRRALRGMLGVGLVGMGGWLASRHAPLDDLTLAWAADHHTGLGERRALTMADGTRVWLNTRTAINVRYDDAWRRLQLLSGELWVDSARDHRPLLVDTTFGRMRALGTTFTVRHDGKRTWLDVFDGAVEVRHALGAVRRVEAGQATSLDAVRIEATRGAEARRAAWVRGRLPADNLPLSELLAELGRYHRTHFSVAPEVAQWRVMGVYPLDDLDAALDLLARGLPIKVHRTLPWWTSIEAG